MAQLTDLHLLPAASAGHAANLARFTSCLETLRSFACAPDLYVITGDIAGSGEVESYRDFLREMLKLESPWLCLMGNHDRPDRFAVALGQAPCAGYRGMGSYRLGNWRLLCIDTSLAGTQGGYFDQQRAELLENELLADQDTPTILAMHHPPVVTGVGWIDPPQDAEWIGRFAGVVGRFSNVRQIICGHTHMAVMTHFNGIPVSVAPATAPQLWPEMAAFDPDRPDDRIMVHDGQPGFALHHCGKDIRTTFAGPVSGQIWLRHNKPRQGAVVTA